jgi:sarcosine oxidase, subunit gamma
MARPTVDRRSALAGLRLFNLSGKVALTAADVACRFIYRGSPDVLGSALGFPLPTTPLRAASGGERAALWLGPDEWLLVAATAEVRDTLNDLRMKLSAAPASLVDVGHRNIGLSLAGAGAGDVLACGCPLDFALAAFPVGMCTRTIFGKCEVVVWRVGDERFHLEAARSFAPYLVNLLAEASRAGIAS